MRTVSRILFTIVLAVLLQQQAAAKSSPLKPDTAPKRQAPRPSSITTATTLLDWLTRNSPMLLNNFQRVALEAHDPTGNDVRVGYNTYTNTGHYASECVLTIYMYNARAYNGITELRPHFEACVHEIQENWPTLKPEGNTAEIKFRKTIGLQQTWATSSKFGSEVRPAFTTLRLFMIGNLAIKYRYTYPQDHAMRHLNTLEGFIEKYPWPTDLAPSFR